MKIKSGLQSDAIFTRVINDLIIKDSCADTSYVCIILTFSSHSDKSLLPTVKVNNDIREYLCNTPTKGYVGNLSCSHQHISNPDTYYIKFNLNKVITADNTFLYLKKGFSDFEKNNFEVACDVANKDNVLKKVSKHEVENFFNGKINSNNFKCVKIIDEFGFNPNLLIHEILKLSIKIGIDIIFQEVKKIVNKNNTYLIDEEYQAKKLVIAAGYGSYEVGKNIFNPVPIVKGVGTAFILQDD